MSNLILPGNKKHQIMAPHLYVNAMSWDDLGNRDDESREVLFNWICKIQLDALVTARDCIVIDGNPEVAIEKINDIIKKYPV